MARSAAVAGPMAELANLVLIEFAVQRSQRSGRSGRYIKFMQLSLKVIIVNS